MRISIPPWSARRTQPGSWSGPKERNPCGAWLLASTPAAAPGAPRWLRGRFASRLPRSRAPSAIPPNGDCGAWGRTQEEKVERLERWKETRTRTNWPLVLHCWSCPSWSQARPSGPKMAHRCCCPCKEDNACPWHGGALPGRSRAAKRAAQQGRGARRRRNGQLR